MADGGNDARKRHQNCFRCWHCRRVEGSSSCCVCFAFVTKKNKDPELITKPYAGKCASFYDKKVEEDKCIPLDLDFS